MSLTKFLQSLDANQEYKGKRYFDLIDTGRIFGMGDDQIRAFINIRGIPFYRPMKRKMYNVIEVFEEIEKTRWAERGDQHDGRYQALR